MRQIWRGCAVLVLLASAGAGCSGRSASDKGELKQAYIRQLIGFCAEVDRQLANVDPKRQPGIFADQFAGFVVQARSQPAPAADRARFAVMRPEMAGPARQFRAAQTALAVGDQSASQQALAQATR